MLASNVAVSGQPVNMEIEGGANISRSRSLTVTKTYVTQTDLESLKNKRTIDMSQTLIKDLEQRNQNVYVITESIETEQEATINTSDSFQAGFSFFSKVGIKSKGKKTKTISIPKGSVFGFRAQLLTIQNGKWAVSHDPNAYGNTFEEKKELILASYVSETDTLTGFPRVKAEILTQCSPLDILPPEEVEDVLKAFLFIMKNPKTISEVEAKVEQVLYSSAHNESSILLELLEELGISKAPKTSYKVLIDLTFFFLNALNGLDEDGVSMLVESVEKQNTEHQLTQVETLLAENFISSEEHDDCQITIGESRPRPILEANGGASESWNLMVQSYAIALYAALCLLHRLSLRSLSTKPKLSSA
ncbi:gasdermin-A3 isoform X2 [Microcaecilia unicolor]|nr:gasdermin-A isoform X2 [Microcaecilia unicolor]